MDAKLKIILGLVLSLDKLFIRNNDLYQVIKDKEGGQIRKIKQYRKLLKEDLYSKCYKYLSRKEFLDKFNELNDEEKEIEVVYIAVVDLIKDGVIYSKYSNKLNEKIDKLYNYLS